MAGGPARPYGRSRKSSSKACPSRLPRMPRSAATALSKNPPEPSPAPAPDLARSSYTIMTSRSEAKPSSRPPNLPRAQRTDGGIRFMSPWKWREAASWRASVVSSAEQHLGHRGKLGGELLLPLGSIPESTANRRGRSRDPGTA